MACLSWRRLAAISMVGFTIAVPPFQRITGNSSIPVRLSLRQEDQVDPGDLSFINKLAAIGDSYSAGIGAGDVLGTYKDWSCRRYDHSYPNLVNQDSRLGDSSNRKFQFESCSGAVINDVIENQIPNLDSNQQVILLSAGGNDAELVDILNQCIFQWAVFDWKQVATGKLAKLKEEKWAANLDFDKFGRGCLKQLSESHDLIESSDFSKRLDDVLAAAKKKLASDGMIYYTGYAKFFDENLTEECDKVSWATWVYKAYNIFHKEEYLTVANRKIMNNLVNAVNDKIEAAVKRAGSSVVFVNYDPYVGLLEGRMCEPGVDESTSESNTRTGLMFYELNSWDPAGSTPWKRSDNNPENGTFAGDQSIFAQLSLFIDPDAEFRNDYVEESAQEAMQKASSKPKLPEQVQSEAELDDFLPNLLPDVYGRVFHPQILLHELIAEHVIFSMINENERRYGFGEFPELHEMDSCPYNPAFRILRYKATDSGQAVKPGTKLRILCVGDSITYGYGSELAGGDGNGYRLQLRDDLSEDEVLFAGTESRGSMDDGYYAAWGGMTIQYIADHVGKSLEQRPNIVLVHAGTNDMNPDHSISKEGNDPEGAADRLGKLIDQIFEACPDATVLVAMIINTCNGDQSPQTKEFQQLIPGVVKKRFDDGYHVLPVDFTTFETSMLRDCIHPTNSGYKVFGDYWYDFMTQIPKKWIKEPVGDDPDHGDGTDANGGLDTNIPPPDWGISPIKPTSVETVSAAAEDAATTGTCDSNPHWYPAGQIAKGTVRTNGDWKYKKFWVSAGKVASGLGLDARNVRLHDMNGDGKADYVWLDPVSGEITCWINNLPDYLTRAGTNGGIIGSGAGPAKSVFIADMNGDGLEDYMVVNPDTGAVDIWWNYGPDDGWANGWKFVSGGQIASGVDHANWGTLRFPDINGDGRADYVYIGQGGSLKHHMNTGSPGGQDVLFFGQGGIATGGTSNISDLIFADLNGDGRDDYLIWDEEGGLTGYLNQPTNEEGVPVYVYQGPDKTLADGIGQKPSSIRLADMDGDGKDDYVYVGDDGSLTLWYNRGETDYHMAIDGLRFADLDGDGRDDYVWLDPETGAPTVYLNTGPDHRDLFGWLWDSVNDGQPIASGAAPASQVKFGDIDGDGKDDYLVLDPKTGELTAYMNGGPSSSSANGWRWNPVGSIATGLGPGANVRFADIDGDGFDDYIYLHPNGGTTIYRNMYDTKNKVSKWEAMPGADASGIDARPEEIEFYDINGDGKADYVWTRPRDGNVQVWLNNYPNQPTWSAAGDVAQGLGTSGNNMRFATLQPRGRADRLAVDRQTGALGAWLNGCDNPSDAAREHQIFIVKEYREQKAYWTVYDTLNICKRRPLYSQNVLDEDTIDAKFPSRLYGWQHSMGPRTQKICRYEGSNDEVGIVTCEDTTGIRCWKDPAFGRDAYCKDRSYEFVTVCDWNYS